MNLNIGYFYPELLNLYGDHGNIEIITKRALLRGFSVHVKHIDHTTKITPELANSFNFVFMGGGPDSSQQQLYDDFRLKKPFLENYIEQNGVGLFVCGGYQLLGNYYKDADGNVLDGLGLLDFHTQHFGKDKKRCIGNIAVEPLNKNIGDTLVGFENHGGRTYVGDSVKPLGKVITGFGNNGEDKNEGVVYKNCFGTYMHGPVLAKNPVFADYLIAQSLNLHVEDLTKLEDSLIEDAHLSQLKKIT